VGVVVVGGVLSGGVDCATLALAGPGRVDRLGRAFGPASWPAWPGSLHAWRESLQTRLRVLLAVAEVDRRVMVLEQLRAAGTSAAAAGSETEAEVS